MSDHAAVYPKEIAKAIIQVMKQVKQLGNDEKNPHAGYAYVSVDKFYDRFGKLMAEAGLALLIDETASEVKEGGKSDKPWLFVQYGLQFLHETGAVSEPMRRSLAMPITGPQTYGAAQSYIEKQFLRQVFKIPTGERDADETAQDDAPARREPQRAGMVRAADVPPTNGSAASVQQRAEKYRDDMKALFARCKVPADVETLIANNGKELEGLKRLAPRVYEDIMLTADGTKKSMYGATG